MPSPTLNRRQWLGIAAGAVAIVGIVAIALVVRGDDESSATDTTAVAVTTETTAAPPSTSEATSVTDDSSSAGTTTDPADSSPSTAPGDSTVVTTVPSPTAPPTTGVPPSPSSLVTVPIATVPVADPIATEEVGDFGTGVTAEIVQIEAVDGEAQLPGEISGPALRVTVRLSNGTDAALELSLVQVDVTSGPDRAPGIALSKPGSAPFAGELAPGATADGVYVFGVPLDQREQVQVQVMYSVDAPILVFEGPAPTA